MAYLGPVKRWEVFWADLEPHVGSEQGGESRPVLVISNDVANKHASVVTVLPLTKLEGKARTPHPWEVVLPVGLLTSGITSLVLPAQVRTIDKLRLLQPMGEVRDPDLRAEIEDALLEHLGIEFEVREESTDIPEG